MGATSGIGALAVEEAVGRGLPVRAFARGADSLGTSDLLTPVAGDARSAEDVSAAITGARAVIYALGIKEQLAMLWEEETLFSESARVLLDAMKAGDIRRLVAVTGFGAGRSRGAMSSIERLGHRSILGKPFADKDRQEALITESDLDYTIVRPVILTKRPKTGRVRILRDPLTWRSGLVPRADVASYLIDAVENEPRHTGGCRARPLTRQLQHGPLHGAPRYPRRGMLGRQKDVLDSSCPLGTTETSHHASHGG